MDVAVGNASGGLLDAPSFKIGTINIGDPQKGRAKSDSIIDCDPTKKATQKALEQLYSSEFQKTLRTVKKNLGEGGAFAKIKEKIKTIKFGNLLKKKFYDIPVQSKAGQNNFMDITDFMEKKLEIMQIFKSEMGEHPFPRSERNLKVLALYGYEYAESFMLLKEI